MFFFYWHFINIMVSDDWTTDTSQKKRKRRLDIQCLCSRSVYCVCMRLFPRYFIVRTPEQFLENYAKLPKLTSDDLLSHWGSRVHPQQVVKKIPRPRANHSCHCPTARAVFAPHHHPDRPPLPYTSMRALSRHHKPGRWPLVPRASSGSANIFPHRFFFFVTQMCTLLVWFPRYAACIHMCNASNVWEVEDAFARAHASTQERLSLTQNWHFSALKEV